MMEILSKDEQAKYLPLQSKETVLMGEVLLEEVDEGEEEELNILS
jgi:hypothetical protein